MKYWLKDILTLKVETYGMLINNLNVIIFITVIDAGKLYIVSSNWNILNNLWFPKYLLINYLDFIPDLNND